MARPSIVPIALTLDDRTGYTLWAPPWEEDGEEWQAFLGTTEGSAAGGRAVVHLFPTPAALAAFCRSSTDHDLADHPVWPVVQGLGAADLTPDDDHRFDLDGVYDVAAEHPDRWAVEELAATIDMVSRLAECLDTSGEDEDDAGGDDRDDDQATDDADGQFEAVAELVGRPEIGSLGLGLDAFAGRSGEDAWAGVGGALDELWEDVVAEIDAHLDWTGAGTATLADYPEADASDGIADEDEDADPATGTGARDDDAPAAVRRGGRAATSTTTGGTATGSTATGSTAASGTPAAGVSTIRGGGRITATPAEVARAAAFWEGVGILPVEVVVPEGAGLTLRCYVEDVARFLGRDREVFLFATPEDLLRFCHGSERHDLEEIASWPEVADTDVPPLPADQDRYDLTELGEVLGEVAEGAAGLVEHSAFLQPVEGVRDLAEYAGEQRVDDLLAPTSELGRAVARAERDPHATLRQEEAGELRRQWDEVVTLVGSALVFRD